MTEKMEEEEKLWNLINDLKEELQTKGQNTLNQLSDIKIFTTASESSILEAKKVDFRYKAPIK